MYFGIMYSYEITVRTWTMCVLLGFVRLVEEVKQKCGGVQLENEDVYMATTFEEFVKRVVLVSRGVTDTKELVYDAVSGIP